MKKKRVFILFIFCITICCFSYAKYVLSYNTNININTAPLYFAATLDGTEFKLLNKQATANLTVKNNDGTNYNLYNSNYTITLEGNSKFSLYVNDVIATNNISTQTINGNSLINNSLEIKIVPNDSSTINTSETANLKISMISPYIKTINIPITITNEVVIVDDLTLAGFSSITHTFDTDNNKFNFSLTTSGGQYEKINIPIKNLEVGKFYQLYFNESTDFALMGGYEFASTVQAEKNLYTEWNDDVRAMLNFEHFTWKTTTTGTKSNQCISFWATAETMYWIWDLSDLSDNNSGKFELRVLSIEKDMPPNTEYIDFPNAYLKFIENTDANYAEDSSYADVAGAHNKVNSQGSFFTKSTYNETLLKFETMKAKYEKMYVPIENLTIGKEYTLNFDAYTNATLTSDHYYGYEITDTITSAMNSNDNSWAKNSSNFISINSGNATSSTTFTATAETMYWVWSFSKFADFYWFDFQITNASITENVSTLSLRNFEETESIEKQDDSLSENVVTNCISNTTNTNTVTNNVVNEITNSTNNVTNTTTNITNTNEISNTTNTNNATNSVTNSINMQNTINTNTSGFMNTINGITNSVYENTVN